MQITYVYRINLVGTDLYYQPVKGKFVELSNFGERGKIYTSKPEIKKLGSSFSISSSLIKKYDLVSRVKECSYIKGRKLLIIDKDKDFKIIKFELKEVKENEK